MRYEMGISIERSKRKKAIVLLLISAFLFGVTAASTSAVAAAAATKTLVVHKVVENADNIKVGDKVIVKLQFKNPFKQPIPLRIVDRNVIGNNGLDIRCLEYTLPAKEESVFAYSDPIVPFKPGKYTLDAAKITYTNPETGKRETVESNTLDIQVKANNSQQQLQGQQTQGITTIYQCNGTYIHSTSYSSSGGSFNIQIGSSTHSYGNKQQSQSGSGGQQHQESIEKRITNNQISQNGGKLKKELEKEMQQHKEQEEQIRKELAKNPDFVKYDKQLRNAGFNQTPASFNLVSQNHTQVTIPYRNESTGAERRIKADYINGTIQNVTLETISEHGHKEEQRGSPWWLLLLIPLTGVIATGWFIFDKYLKKARRKEIQPQPTIAVESAQSVDYVREARRFIEEAEHLFRNGREKDAYEKVSKAIRFYFSHKLGIKRELLNTELMNALKGRTDTETYSIQR
ncbi:MAG: hypothetical protein C4B56_00460 [Candidatus Methanophagaceae archaeon]|nr:MAG: hypothetical protein C4B56_00460 [Methanophagales archaeon]